MKSIALLLFSVFLCTSCSPLKSSPNEEKHQMELTIHEMQTGIDDLKHDYNCYQTDLQILDEKIKNQESSIADIKNVFIESQKNKLEEAIAQLTIQINKLKETEQKVGACEEDIYQLTSHANESTNAFTQHKEKIDELEKQIFHQNKKFEEILKLKSTIETLAQLVGNYQVYKVRRGDSLEKIAKENKTSIDQIKRLNKLENDLIVIDQELKIPTH